MTGQDLQDIVSKAGRELLLRMYLSSVFPRVQTSFSSTGPRNSFQFYFRDSVLLQNIKVQVVTQNVTA